MNIIESFFKKIKGWVYRKWYGLPGNYLNQNPGFIYPDSRIRVRINNSRKHRVSMLIKRGNGCHYEKATVIRRNFHTVIVRLPDGNVIKRHMVKHLPRFI